MKQQNNTNQSVHKISKITFPMMYPPCHLLMRGLDLKTISKPLTSRAQLSWSNEAHGTVREMAWMKPSVTSNGASTDSKISFKDCRNVTQGLFVFTCECYHHNNQQILHWHNVWDYSIFYYAYWYLVVTFPPDTYPFVQWHLCKGTFALVEVHTELVQT